MSKVKPDYKQINFLLSDDPTTLKIEKEFRKKLRKRKNPLVYVRPHTRRFPEKRTNYEKLFILKMQRFRINREINKCRTRLRNMLPTD